MAQQDSPVIVIAAIAIVGVLFSLVAIYSRMVPSSSSRSTVIVALATSFPGALAWLVVAPLLVGGVPLSLLVPIAALASVASFLSSLAVRAAGASLVHSVIYAALWSALVFVPIASSTFFFAGPSTFLGVQPVDHGGSLAVNVAAGASAMAVLLSTRAGDRRPRTSPVSHGVGTAAVLTLTVGWLAWLVAAELAIDDATPAILINGIVGAIGGMVGWLVVQRIRHQSTSLAALAGGVVSGLVAVTAGAPLFSPVSATAAGAIAGGVACLFTISRVRASRRQQWFIVGSHLVAGGIGVIVLGLLATNLGLIYTGQIDLISQQILATAIVAIYSGVVSLMLWALLRWVSRSPWRPASVG